jgi:hypothetical protein
MAVGAPDAPGRARFFPDRCCGIIARAANWQWSETAMATGDEGSVTHWLGELNAGDPTAAQRLWALYFSDLVRRDRACLRAAPRAAEDEEDVALHGKSVSVLLLMSRGTEPRPARDPSWFAPLEGMEPNPAHSLATSGWKFSSTEKEPITK